MQGRNEEITGTVTDTDGEAVAGATVTAVTGDSSQTDEQGRYALSVPDGDPTIFADTVGYESITRRVDPSEGGDLSFESEIRPDIQRTRRLSTQVAPGTTTTLELAIEHAEFATIFVGESPHLVETTRRVALVDLEASGRPQLLGIVLRHRADLRPPTVKPSSCG